MLSLSLRANDACFLMDIRTLYLVVGIVYLVVPFSLYLSTRKTTDLQIGLWNLAWISMGLGALLVGLRDAVPPWMSFMVSPRQIVIGDVVARSAARDGADGLKLLAW